MLILKIQKIFHSKFSNSQNYPNCKIRFTGLKGAKQTRIADLKIFFSTIISYTIEQMFSNTAAFSGAGIGLTLPILI